jgi:tetratricopeptide (TPR) repeat protein
MSRSLRPSPSLALFLLLLAAVAAPAHPAFAAPEAPVAAAQAPPATASGQPAAPAESADYDFLIANLQASDGMLPEALALFEKAEKDRPDSAYVHLEHAQVLGRMAQGSRPGTAQTNYLRQAAAQVDKARQLAPHNLDVLRGVGAVYIELASVDPLAATTALDALQTVHQSEPDDVQTALNLGRLYLEQQQAAKAAAIFRDIIERFPQQRAAYALLVESLLRDDKGKEAEAVLAQILDFEPDAIEARLTLAELQNRRGDYRAELATLSAAPADEQPDPRLQRQLGWAYYMTGDINRALATVDPLLAHGGDAATAADGEDSQLLLLKGLILAAQGNNDQAAEALEKVRGTRPNDPGLASITSKVLARAGHTERAAHVLAELDSGLAKAGKQDEEHQARLELAQVYYDAKDWDRVGETLQPLLRLAADDQAARESAQLLAADALVQRKSYDAALQLLDQGQAAHPLPALAGKRAEVLFKAGRSREAGHDLDQLAASKDPLAALAAAETYQRLERYPESVPVLERVLAKTPDLQPQSIKAAQFLLGAGYERSGKRDQAVSQFRRLLDADPDYHAALNYLGYMYAERGENLAEAKTMIEKAVSLDPDNGAYVDSLGWVYYRLGRLDDARAALERATRLETSDSTVQEHLGDVYGALGQPGRAGEAYRHAIALAGADDPAKAKELQHKLDTLGGGAHRP